MWFFRFHKVQGGGFTILVYLKISIECFVLLLIMMNSQHGLGDRDKDIDEFIKQEKDNPNFKNMFNKIMKGGSSTKKVENFLGGNQMMAMHDYQKDPELIKTLQEIINTPGYDPDSVIEAQRQMLRIRQGLPRFPTA